MLFNYWNINLKSSWKKENFKRKVEENILGQRASADKKSLGIPDLKHKMFYYFVVRKYNRWTDGQTRTMYKQ